MRSKALLTATFLFIVLGSIEASACEALNLECPENMTLGQLKVCLNNKKVRIQQCSRELTQKLEVDQVQILEMLDEKAGLVTDGLDTELHAILETLHKINKINADNRASLEDLSVRFSSLVKRYKDKVAPELEVYKSSQLRIRTRVEAVRNVDLDTRTSAYLDLEIELAKDYNDIHTRVSQTIYSLAIIRENIEFFSSRYLEDIKPHRAFLKQKGIEGAVYSTDKMIQSLGIMSKQLHNWLVATSKQHERNSQIIAQLVESVVKEKAEAISKPILDQYYRNQASVEFLQKSSQEIRLAFVEYSNEQSSAGVPLTNKKYLAIENFLEFAKICEASYLIEWMESGCRNILNKKQSALNYKNNIPFDLKQNLSFMADYISDDDKFKIDVVSKAIAHDDLNTATRIYDEIVRRLKI